MLSVRPIHLHKSISLRSAGRTAVLVALMMGTLTATASAGSFGTQIQNSWVNGLRQMTGQIIASGVDLIGAIGGMIDGADILEAQRVVNKLHAEAIKDYTPGDSLCRFGTLSRSLAASQTRSFENRTAFNQMLLNRETLNDPGTPPSEFSEGISRLHNLRTLYCDPGDNDKTPVACNCDVTAGTCNAADGPLPSRSNRDLDFARLWGSRLTVNADFTNNTMTPDEQDLLAFVNNVVSVEKFPEIMKRDTDLATDLVPAYMLQDVRQVIAARSVVRNSITHQLGDKVAGEPGVSTYMVNVLREMGMTDAEARRMLEAEGQTTARPGTPSGTDINPSYEAQMEILTKKLYQNPNFYTNLVDKPANVERTKAAMLAIGLMQRRDIFETMLRREMLLSQLLEMRVADEYKLTKKRVTNAMANAE